MAAPHRHIHKFIILLGILCLVPMWAVAEEPARFILRAATIPETDIWIGQRVLYQVDVLGRNGWAKIQRMNDIQVSGAILVPFESQGVRLNETIDDEAYTGQRYELSLFPQRSGRISVSSVTVDIEISQWGGKTQRQVLQGTIPPVNFVAKFPSGAENVQGLLSTSRLTAEQQWEPNVSQVDVGGAIQRTIQLEAENISAMAFTPILFSASDDTDVYPQTPTLKDQYSRGTLTGRRTERVTYVFKKAGRAELPSITITWWDLKSEKLRKTVLPSRVIEISPSNVVQSKDMVKEDAPNKRQWAYIGTILVLFIILIGLFQKYFRLRWNAWRRVRNESEKAYFRRFVKAARSGNPNDALNALMHWLDRIHTGDQAARLDQFLDAYSDPEVAKEAERLIQAIDPKAQTPWQGSALIKGINRARRKWWRQRRRRKIAHGRLPLLNP